MSILAQPLQRFPGESEEAFRMRLAAQARATQLGVLSSIFAPGPPAPAFAPPVAVRHSPSGTVQSRLAQQQAAAAALWNEQQQNWTQQRPNESNVAYDLRGLVSRALGGDIKPPQGVQTVQDWAQRAWQFPGRMALKAAEAFGDVYSQMGSTPNRRKADEVSAVRDVAGQMARTMPQFVSKPRPLGNNPAAFRPESVAPPEGGPPAQDISTQVFNRMVGAESNWNHLWTSGPKKGQVKVSPKGAVGIAQVMPGTGPEAARAAGLPWDEQRYRNDPQYNYAIGKGYFDKLATKYGGNMQLAVAAYNAGPGKVDAVLRGKATLPAETTQYVQKVLGGGNPFGPVPGFAELSGPGWAAASGAIDDYVRNASQPSSFTLNRPEAPQLAEPDKYVTPNFSAGDAAFAKAAPIDPFNDPKEKKNILRRGYLGGLAQAMASSPNGEGLGSLLLRMGGGALGGWTHGFQEIQDRQDKFDEDTRRYQLALSQREDGKAASIASTLNANTREHNDWAQKKWEVAVNQFNKDWSVTPTATGFMATSVGPNNQLITQNVPVQSIVQAQGAIMRARMFGDIAQDMGHTGQWQYTQERANALAAMSMAATEGDPASPQAMVLATTEILRPAVETGAWKTLVTPENRQLIIDAAMRNQGISYKTDAMGQPTTEIAEGDKAALNDGIATILVTQAQLNPALREEIRRQAPSMLAAGAVAHDRDSKRTVRTNAKGEQTMTEAY